MIQKPAFEEKRNDMKRIISLPAILILLLTLPVLTPAGEGLKREGRWLTYNGSYPYLVGMDAQELACDPSLNYEKILDLFVQYRINKVRIWVYCYFGTNQGFLHPWKREANGKFNLDEWNPCYWNRVKDFVTKAKDRDIIVEVSIFPANFIHKAANWTNIDWWPLWNKKFNVNGIFTTNSEGHFAPEFFDLNHLEVSYSGKKLIDYQKALVDKTIVELKSYENVCFEICNEFPVSADIDTVYPWQQHWARYISNVVPSLLVTCHSHEFSGSHIKGIQFWWNESYIDILNFHFYEYNPKKISDLLHEVHAKEKIISLNESGTFYKRIKWWLYRSKWSLDTEFLNRNTRMAYGMFLSGGYFTLYCADNSKIGDNDWEAGARRMKVLRDIAESVEFWKMSPVDDSGKEYDLLINQGPAGDNWQVLANPEKEFVVYFWGDKSGDSVKMKLSPGNYHYEWYDCEDGDKVKAGHIGSGGTITIPAPLTSSWNSDIGVVLIIKLHEKKTI